MRIGSGIWRFVDFGWGGNPILSRNSPNRIRAVISDRGGGREMQWSAETIRRRGVRAVVTGLRLRKQHAELVSQRANHFEENRLLRAHLHHLTALNGVLREFIHGHDGREVFTQKTGNYWNDRCEFDK